MDFFLINESSPIVFFILRTIDAIVFDFYLFTLPLLFSSYAMMLLFSVRLYTVIIIVIVYQFVIIMQSLFVFCPV